MNSFLIRLAWIVAIVPFGAFAALTSPADTGITRFNRSQISALTSSGLIDPTSVIQIQDGEMAAFLKTGQATITTQTQLAELEAMDVIILCSVAICAFTVGKAYIVPAAPNMFRVLMAPFRSRQK